MEKINKELVPLQKKSIPPYAEVKEGYGYMGVILWDAEKDLVQCHICGLMFQALSRHLVKHKVTTKDYRRKFGLNSRTPLSNVAVLSQRKENGWKLWKNILEGKLVRKTFTKEEMSANARSHNGRKNDEFVNKFGTCPEQLDTRFDEEMKKVGHVPGKGDLSTSLYSSLRRRYGSYERYLQIRELEPTVVKSTPYGLTRENILDLFDKFNSDFGRLPVIKDCEEGLLPPILSASPIKRLFGSFSEAKRVFEGKA